MRTFEEFNILVQSRGPDSGSILKNWSGDRFANFRHLLLRFVHEASFSHPCLPVYLEHYISFQCGICASGLSSLVVGLGPFVVLPMPILCRLTSVYTYTVVLSLFHLYHSRAKPEPSNSFLFKIEFIYFLELLGI